METTTIVDARFQMPNGVNRTDNRLIYLTNHTLSAHMNRCFVNIDFSADTTFIYFRLDSRNLGEPNQYTETNEYLAKSLNHFLLVIWL